MNTYIIHYSLLKERKPHIIKELDKHNIINYKFVEEYNQEVLTHELLRKFVKPTISEISLFYKHLHCWNTIIYNDTDINLVFEDDAVLKENFYNNLNDYISQLPIDWDIGFFGDCVNLSHTDLTDNINVYKIPRSRGTCFYVINKKCAYKLYNLFNKDTQINQAVDHWLNYAIHKLNLNCFWSEPTLVHQGSELHIFKKSIEIS